MSEHDRLYRRLLRRETHASRTAPAVAAATLGAVFAPVVIIVGVLALLVPSLFESVVAIVRDAASNPGVAAAVGGALLVVGAVFVLLAILPGRRTRHTLITDRAGVVIESSGLAESIATTVATACRLDRDQVRVSVHRRRLVTVTVRPVSGVSVDRAGIEAATRSTTVTLGLQLQPRVVILREGTLA
ncbi:MAG TPA: hypothetical protein H9830_13810 [Candidatus Agrococcus pullicola]|uniref:Uncharacterized protein n=1 Tax=Candidatus Agrococcus pullicola TaxID=2838429 RepID=A0A9D2CAH8_9MICO|nr:hypothetical protein [Candidatus Agrococcus pullicola]